VVVETLGQRWSSCWKQRYGELLEAAVVEALLEARSSGRGAG
jgi:hypothetical protein